MPRPRRPTWSVPGKGRPGYWRTIINGVTHRCPLAIPRDERPQYKGVPDRAWKWLKDLETADALARAQDASQRGPGPVTLESLMVDYAASRRALADAGEVTSRGADGTRSKIKLFLNLTPKGIRKLPAEAYTIEHLQQFFKDMRGILNERREPTYSKNYVSSLGRTICAAFRWGAKPVSGRNPARMLALNPLDRVDFPTAPRRVRGYIEGQAVRRFFRFCWRTGRAQTGLKRRFDRLFVLMLWFQRMTGCRPGETYRLLWVDIHWTENLAIIPPERHKTGKITGKPRTLYLGSKAIRLLRFLERLPGRHPDHVFTHIKGKATARATQKERVAGDPWQSENSSGSTKFRHLRRRAIAAGLEGIENIGPNKLVPYLSRHAYASDMIAMGATHEQVAAVLGNSAAIVASTYAHPIVEAELKLAQDLEEFRRTGKRIDRTGKGSS